MVITISNCFEFLNVIITEVSASDHAVSGIAQKNSNETDITFTRMVSVISLLVCAVLACSFLYRQGVSNNSIQIHILKVDIISYYILLSFKSSSLRLISLLASPFGWPFPFAEV